MISLQDAVEDLYRIAVVEGKSQSPKRLAMLAHMCVEQLAERGILGADTEVPVPGIGRSKNWDVVWPRDGRVPEIVTGYIMVFDTTGSGLRQDGTRWVDFFRDAVNRLSGRDAPAWAAGMVEASAIVEVAFAENARIVTEPDMSAFFDRLAHCVRDRNPDAFRGGLS